jgi:succinoglycan biosynthesis protein ExoL
MAPPTVKILILAQDLTDPAIARRIAMLKAGGATVSLAGFRRTYEKIETIHGCPAINFGQTYNRAFFQRIIAILRTMLSLHCYVDFFAGSDIILARNLEMLAIATRAQSLIDTRPSIVYEMLDIHRLLLAKNLVGSLMRAIEKTFMRKVTAIITSSPAYIANYFLKIQRTELPIRLIENKLLDINQTLQTPTDIQRNEIPPWKIGWFGIIRCRKSLLILRDLVQNHPRKIEVIIRGKPALDAINDFHEIVKSTPGLCYLGPYKNPEDLETIYSGIHFTWAIDMFEEGQNSSWLLPNRIYEGSFFGAVPLVMDGLETSNFLKNLHMGISIKEPLKSQLNFFFATLTPQSYQNVASAVQNIPRSTWVYDQSDCQELVSWFLKLRQSPRQVANA